MTLVAYSLADGVLIDDDGEVCEITQMLDAWGDATDDLGAAVALIAERGDGVRLTVVAGDVIENAWLQ